MGLGETGPDNSGRLALMYQDSRDTVVNDSGRELISSNTKLRGIETN